MTHTLVLIAGLVGLAAADNWDRFRGPNGTGTIDDKGVPLTFGASDNVVWKVASPGAGNSSPVVWGKHLFLQSASNDGKLRSLLCLDTANGKIRWQRSIPGTLAKIRADSSQASSTPTTDGEAVYVSFWDGQNILLSAYDFQGNVLWSKELGPFNSQHGPGASPILYKDKLILANDMDKDDFFTKVPNMRPSMLMALDRRTGQLLWETPRVAERANYSAPFLLQKPGQKEPELVVTSSTAVTGYHVETGAMLWEAKGWQEHALKSPMRTVATPALAGDVLCVCSGGDAGRFAVGLALPGSGNADAPTRLWENRKDFPYVPSPVARGEYFYFVNDVGFAGCYHTRTGKRVWFERLADTGFHASPLVIDGKVYATSIAGDVYVFAAEPTFQLLARNELGETIRATAAVSGGRLYIRGERHLYCIGTSRPEDKEGDVIFEPGAKLKVESKDGGGEGPAWHPKLGVLMSGRGSIYRLDRQNKLSIYRDKAGTNGLLFDPQGRLLACEPVLRRVTRTDTDGKITVLTDSYEGKRYNQPNDLTMDSKGRIYFSDPRYGNRSGMEIRDAEGRTIEGVYRIDPDGKVTRILGRELDRPNGLLVSADDRRLFVADNNNDTKGGARKLWRFDLRPDGTADLDSRKLLYDWDTGRGPDGLKHDQKGRLYVAGGLNKPNPPFEPALDKKGGIYVFSPEGKLLAFLPVPTDEVTNCAFGGDDLRTLYVTGGGTLYSIRTTTPGRLLYP